jgi:hypothetical protein
MSTISAILEPDADGTLHLPLPAELRGGKVKVEAKLEPADPQPKSDTESTAHPLPQPGCLKGFWMAPDFDAPLEDFKEYME